jgi:hypothetical protein
MTRLLQWSTEVCGIKMYIEAVKGTPSIPNYKTFWLYEFRKAKTSYNLEILEWREYNIILRALTDQVYSHTHTTILN